MDISVVILTRSSKNILQKQAKKTDFINSVIQTNQPSGTLSEAEAHNNHQPSIINHQQTANRHSPTFTIN
ncbi:hypothetical protein [Chryseobacterium gambrini]|uniref:hypothetical protein n=1 Tax=Chryseobacterium gambrini TaxID=373672 RepID=UPI0022F3E72E|nr:hypothetical protein [Chryseobacterium gambrini]WBX96338.1 hypothetical protein PE065_15990 [Chryseobacterium gambrini]